MTKWSRSNTKWASLRKSFARLVYTVAQMGRHDYRMAPTTSPHGHGMNGAVVRQIRAEAAAGGITDAQLAEAVGVHPTVMSRYLNCKRALTLGLTERLAEALGLTYEELVHRAWSERREQ